MQDTAYSADLMPKSGPPAKWRAGGFCIVLASLVWMVFGQTRDFDFVNFDDGIYVTDNTLVTGPLNSESVLRAFTELRSAHQWNPMTTLSLMLDHQLHGKWAGGYHLTNVLLHGVTAMLLFLLLWQMTGVLGRSAVVAAVFAIHPLRVESVAWVTERKDVLSGLFFVLTLSAYVRYTRRPSLPRYLVILPLFCLGLLAKPILVTLPFLLLVLDHWPLRRLWADAKPAADGTARTNVSWWAIFEKVPLVVLSFLSSWMTLHSTSGLENPRFSLLERCSNALVGYGVYPVQLLFPFDLAVFYPLREHGQPLFFVVVSGLGILAVSVVLILLRKERPYLLAGWLWYIGVLVPVSGIILVGEQAHADRFTYLPHIGLILALIWLAADLLENRRLVWGTAATAAIITLTLIARTQTSYWRDSETLWTRALACTTANQIAHQNLGVILMERGRTDDAITHFRQVLEIDPHFADAHYNLATCLFTKGRSEEAQAHFQTALDLKPIGSVRADNNLGYVLLQSGRAREALPHLQRAAALKPNYAIAENNLGNAFLQLGEFSQAIVHYQKAVSLQPDYPEAEANLGVALSSNSQIDEAILHYEKAIRLRPSYAKAHYNLACALTQADRAREAISHYQSALESKPDHLAAANNLAWLLATHPDATLRSGVKAVEIARQANHLAGGENPRVLRTLAAAYAESGRFDDATQSARKSLSLAELQADAGLVASLRYEIPRYEARMPLHELR